MESNDSYLKYQILFKNLSQGIIYYNSKGEIIEANPFAIKTFGLEVDEFKKYSSGKKKIEIYNSNGDLISINFKEIYINLTQRNTIQNEVVGVKTKENQEIKWLLINIEPINLNDNSNESAILITFTEISKQIKEEKKLRKQTQLLEYLTKISKTFISLKEEEFTKTVNESLAELGQFIHADRFYIFDYDLEKETCNNTFEWCADGIKSQIDNLKNIPIAKYPLWLEQHLLGNEIIINDVDLLDDSNEIKSALKAQDIKSTVTVPLMDGNNCIGFIGLDSVTQKHKFSEQELTLLKIFSGLIVNVKNRFYVEKALKTSNFELGERHKELNCIYNLVQLDEELLDTTTYFEKVAVMIPAGFQIPDKTSCEIVHEEKTYRSKLFKTSNNFIEANLDFNNLKKGFIKIYSPENVKFLNDEYILINNIVKSIGQHFVKTHAKQSVKQSEEKYRIIVENTFNWEFWERPDGSFIYHSPAVFDLTGYTDQELINDHQLCQKIIHPDDYTAYLNHHKNVEVKTKPDKFYFRIITKSREIKYIEHVCKPVFDENKNYIGIRGTNIDISERKIAEEELRNSEERLKTLLASQTSYVIRTDIYGLHTYWNRKFEEDYGWLYENKGLNQADALKSICEYHHEKARKTVEKCFENPNEPIKVELDKPRKNGGINTTLWEFVCITDSEGKPIEIQCMGIDITDRKIAEKKIKESELKYKTLFLNSPDSYLIASEGKFIDCNDSSLALLGYEKSELIGKTPESISPEFQENGIKSEKLIKGQIEEVFSKGKNSFEWIHKKKNGELFYVNINLTSIKYEGKDAIFTSWRDITESKKMQLALKKSEERFRQIAEHSGSVIWEVDLNGKYKYVSPASYQVFGYESEELIGKHFYDLHPEESKLEYKKSGIELLNKGLNFTNFENPIVTKNGKQIWVSTNATPIYDVHNKMTGYIGADIDITERKLAEEELAKFRIISDQANYGSAIADLNGNLTYCNKAFAVMHGYTIEEIIGKHVSMLHNNEQTEHVNVLLKKIIDEGGFNTEEVAHCRKDGSVFPTLMNAKLFNGMNGSAKFLSATLIDISERKEIEKVIIDLNQNLEKRIIERTQELETAKQDAENANKSKSEFLSRMSHELRTPMNSILGFAQLLEMGDLNPNQIKGVHHILRSGQHLLDLINEVLDISRIESGKISISVEPVELNHIINEIIETLLPISIAKNIEIYFDSNSNQKQFIKADKQRLKQVIINLLNNALKYNSNNGKVWIITQNIIGEYGENVIRVTIKDNGIGIAESNLDKIFKPFERINEGKNITEGTGLGLAVVKQLIELMGGKVGVKSEIELGSEFWFDLPECLSELDRVIINGELDKPDLKLLPKKGNILYIEDNSSNIDLIEQVLNNKRPQINLITNMSGKQAVELAIQYKPELILLDLNLPDIHGSEVLKNLKSNQNSKHIPVIIISADAMPKQIDELYITGASNYLTKPIELSSFLTEVDKYFITL